MTTTARLSLISFLFAAALAAAPPEIAVKGRVLDGKKEPIEGVAVYFTSSERPATLRALVATGAKVRTDAEGRYELKLPPGSYDLLFHKEGFVTKRLRGEKLAKSREKLDVTLDPAAIVRGAIVRSDGSPIARAVIETTSVADALFARSGDDGSFTLSDLPAGEIVLLATKADEFVHEVKTISAPARNVTIEVASGGSLLGRVVAAGSGEPVEKFTVHVSPVPTRVGGSPPSPVSRNFNSKDGAFAWKNVTAAEIEIVVTAPGYLPSRLTPAWLESGANLDTGTVEMQKGIEIGGRVTSDGTPVHEVAIAMETVDGMELPGLEWIRARTSRDGEFTLVAPPNREWILTFRKPGFVPQRKQIAVGDSPHRVDVELARGLRVEGIVVEKNNQPVAGASIAGYSGLQGADILRAVSGADGRFVLEGAVEGRYSFEVAKPGSTAKAWREVDLAKTRELRFVLESGGSLIGTVRGLPAAALPSVIVTAESEGSIVRANVDANGKFRMDVPHGTARVSAMLDTRTMQRTTPIKTVEVRGGREARVDFDFGGGSSLRGIVTRETQPAAGYAVTAEPFDPRLRTRARVMTAGTGAYEIEGLEGGNYNVRVLDRERVLYEKLVKIDGATAHDIEIATAALTGRVIDLSSGEPLAGVAVSLQKSAKETTDVFAIGSSLTDAAGRYAIPAVPPGTYAVRALKDGYGQEVANVELTASSTLEKDFGLTAQQSVVLRIYDERTQKPIAAELWVFDSEKRTVLQGMPPPGIDGTVRFSLAQGNYYISVGAVGYASKLLPFRVPTNEFAIPMSPGGSVVFHTATRQLVRLIYSTGTCYLPTFYSSQCEIAIEPGTTKFDYLRKGKWSIHILDANGNIRRREPIEIEDGIAVDVQL